MEAQLNSTLRPVVGGWLATLRRLLLGAVLLLAVHVRAEIQFDVTVGIEGYIPESSWFPVVCEVNNDGPAFQGVIEVVNANFGQNLSRQVQVELQIGRAHV